MSAIEQLLSQLPTLNAQLENSEHIADMTWYSFFESKDTLKVVYIFRSKGNEMLIAKNGKILEYTWEFIANTNSLSLNLPHENLLYNAVLLKGHYLLLRLASSGKFKLLVNQAYFQRILEVAPKKVEKVILKDLKNLIPDPEIPIIEFPFIEEDEPDPVASQHIDNDENKIKERTTLEEKIESPVERFIQDEELGSEEKTDFVVVEEEIEAQVEERFVETIPEKIEPVIKGEYIDNEEFIAEVDELQQHTEVIKEKEFEEESTDRPLSILEKLHQKKGLTADEEEGDDEIAYPFGEKKASLNDKLKEKLNKEKQETLLEKLANKVNKD